jgi:hypothetical protein
VEELSDGDDELKASQHEQQDRRKGHQGWSVGRTRLTQKTPRFS